MFRIQTLTVVLALFLASCGGSSNHSSTPSPIQGIAIANSAYAGAVIAARAADANYPGSSVYFYEFATGQVTEMLATESRDPGVFIAGQKALIFHRGNSVPTLQILDPFGSTAPTSPLPLDTMAEGDPWDLVDISAGGTSTTSSTASKDSVLLVAAPKAGKLITLTLPDSTEDQIKATPVADAFELPQGTSFRPTGLLRDRSKVWVIHQGLNVSENSAIANGTQAIYALDVTDPFAPIGTAPGSSALSHRRGSAPGLAVTGSAVKHFSNKKSGSPLLVSLCQDEMGAQCHSGIDRLNPTAGNITSLTTTTPLQSDAYGFFNSVIDGESGQIVYVQANKKDTGTKMLIRVDVSTGGISEVMAYPDERLYGAVMDDSTQTLLVGNFADLSGEMKLYKNSNTVGSFALPAVPYSVALITK